LQAIVEEHFNISTIRLLPRIVYAAGFSREQISLLAPKVVAAAKDDDPSARQIMRSAGEELAQTGLGVIRQLFDPETHVDVYLTGGVFSAGNLFLDAFRATLRGGWPTATPREPRFPPAVGGLILAARSLGQSIDAAWLDNVATSLTAVQS
jgi:N-acetylglucosamine kinase-like BadF-type ATPase